MNMSIVTKATRAIGMRRAAVGVVAALAILATVSVRTQMPENVLRARHVQVSVLTSPDGLVTGVAGNLDTVTGIADFVFCMSYDKPLPKPIKWTGPGTVIYGAAGKIPGLEHAPEQLGPGSGVTVLPDAGSGWLFESPGTKAPLRPEDQGKAANATRIATRPIRMDPAPRGSLSFCGRGPVGG